MRLRARVDDNQAAIVSGLRAAGCSVLCLHQIGKGVPDLIVGTRRGNLFLEVKDGSKPRSARRLTHDEECWHAGWLGPRDVVSSLAEATAALVRHGLWVDRGPPPRQTPAGDTRGSTTTSSAAT